jgi:hypothetical protein
VKISGKGGLALPGLWGSAGKLKRESKEGEK